MWSSCGVSDLTELQSDYSLYVSMSKYNWSYMKNPLGVDGDDHFILSSIHQGSAPSTVC